MLFEYVLWLFGTLFQKMAFDPLGQIWPPKWVLASPIVFAILLMQVVNLQNIELCSSTSRNHCQSCFYCKTKMIIIHRSDVINIANGISCNLKKKFLNLDHGSFCDDSLLWYFSSVLYNMFYINFQSIFNFGKSKTCL